MIDYPFYPRSTDVFNWLKKMPAHRHSEISGALVEFHGAEWIIVRASDDIVTLKWMRGEKRNATRDLAFFVLSDFKSIRLPTDKKDLFDEIQASRPPEVVEDEKFEKLLLDCGLKNPSELSTQGKQFLAQLMVEWDQRKVLPNQADLERFIQTCSGNHANKTFAVQKLKLWADHARVNCNLLYPDYSIQLATAYRDIGNWDAAIQIASCALNSKNFTNQSAKILRTIAAACYLDRFDTTWKAKDLLGAQELMRLASHPPFSDPYVNNVRHRLVAFEKKAQSQPPIVDDKSANEAETTTVEPSDKHDSEESQTWQPTACEKANNEATSPPNDTRLSSEYDICKEKASAILAGYLRETAGMQSEEIQVKEASEEFSRLLAMITAPSKPARDSAKRRIRHLAAEGGWNADADTQHDMANVSDKPSQGEMPKKRRFGSWTREEKSRVAQAWSDQNSARDGPLIRSLSEEIGRSILAIIIRLYQEGSISIPEGDAFCRELDCSKLLSEANIKGRDI